MNKPKGLIDLSRANKPALPNPEPISETPPVREAPAPVPDTLAPSASSSVAEPTAPRREKPRSDRATPPPTAVAQTPPPAPDYGVEPVVALGVRVPVALHRRVKLYCFEHGIEMQQFAKDALTRHLDALQSGQKQ